MTQDTLGSHGYEGSTGVNDPFGSTDAEIKAAVAHLCTPPAIPDFSYEPPMPRSRQSKIHDCGVYYY